jgi:hypothetical protein
MARSAYSHDDWDRQLGRLSCEGVWKLELVWAVRASKTAETAE